MEQEASWTFGLTCAQPHPLAHHPALLPMPAVAVVFADVLGLTRSAIPCTMVRWKWMYAQ
eukprot:1161840-Pelagomonas_calceolata.AAC.18